MASNDSGVDTSNDSCCTNDNNNSSNNSNSNISYTISFIPEPRRYEIMSGLEQIAQNVSPFQSSPIGASTPSSRGESSSKMLHQIPRSSSCGRRPSHRTFQRIRSNSFVPYVTASLKERKLRMAACVSNTEQLVSLLESGVNPNAADEHKRCPLHLAASRGFKDVVKLLLTYGANANNQDTLGNTPLHLAVCSASSYNFNMVVRMLLQNGARVTLLDRSGKTALDLARSKLTMMRKRRKMLLYSSDREWDPSPEAAKAFVEMSMLTSLLQKTLTNQLTDNAQFDDLEARLRNLSTKEIEEEADKLLSNVACLKLE